MMNPNPHDLECVAACNDCATACLQCATACLAEEDPKMMARCIALDLECADICRLTASALARGDEHRHAIGALCEQICRACADECARHQMDHCQQCATACARCADACAKIAD